MKWLLLVFCHFIGQCTVHSTFLLQHVGTIRQTHGQTLHSVITYNSKTLSWRFIKILPSELRKLTQERHERFQELEVSTKNQYIPLDQQYHSLYELKETETAYMCIKNCVFMVFLSFWSNGSLIPVPCLRLFFLLLVCSAQYQCDNICFYLIIFHFII